MWCSISIQKTPSRLNNISIGGAFFKIRLCCPYNSVLQSQREWIGYNSALSDVNRTWLSSFKHIFCVYVCVYICIYTHYKRENESVHIVTRLIHMFNRPMPWCVFNLHLKSGSIWRSTSIQKKPSKLNNTSIHKCPLSHGA